MYGLGEQRASETVCGTGHFIRRKFLRLNSASCSGVFIVGCYIFLFHECGGQEARRFLGGKGVGLQIVKVGGFSGFLLQG